MDNMKKELYAKLINNKNDSELEKFELGQIFKINDISIGKDSITLFLDTEHECDSGFDSSNFQILDSSLHNYDLYNAEDKIIEISSLCSTIVSLSNLYNNDVTCVDYDEIINMLKVVIQKQFSQKKRTEI